MKFKLNNNRGEVLAIVFGALILGLLASDFIVGDGWQPVYDNDIHNGTVEQLN
jgi:hypothetical protein